MITAAFVLLALLASLALPIAALLSLARIRANLRDLARRVERLERAAERPEAVPPPLPATAARVAPRAAPPMPGSAAPAAAVAMKDGEPEALEAQIGGRLLLYAGMFVLVLGLAFFLRYAFDRDWMSAPVRVALGAAIGAGLAAGGYRLAARYRGYGLFLSGGGIAVLYLSIYAALNLYALIPAFLAFVLLVAVTAAGALLADRTRSQPLALMAVGGGFLVPFLVGGDQDAQATLFTYVALLVAATMFLARRQSWPWLDVASLVFTALTVVAWADAHYASGKYLRTHLFLTLYCAMFLGVLRSVRRLEHPHAGIVRALLALAPAAYHVTSVVILRPHEPALPVYLVAVTVAAVIAGLHYDSAALRLAAWVAVALPLAPWLEDHQSGAWIAGAVATIAGIHFLHLAAQMRTVKAGAFVTAEVLLLHLNGVGLFAGLYESLRASATVDTLALLALALAGVNGGIASAMRRASLDAALQWAGTAFTLVAIAVALALDGPWAVAMWAAEAAAVAWIAIRQDREWLRAGAMLLVVLAVYRWLSADVQEVYLGQGAFANARSVSGAFVVAILYAVAWLQRGERDGATGRRAAERAAILVAASALTVLIVSVEIGAFWELRTTAGSDAYLARELMLSASWAGYAALLVVVGIRRRYAPIRYFAIALFGLTLGKVFLVDLGTLGGIYRVVGFMVVGVILLLVSFLYQRDRGTGSPAGTSPGP